MKKKLISFGLPCYNEQLNIVPTYNALKKIASEEKEYDFEYIFVDNGSSDKTKKEILKLAKKNKRVKGIFLSRNFGPEASGQATLDWARGDAFVFVEADLQDPPNYIPKFIRFWESGFDVVVGSKTNFPDNKIIALGRKIFYKIFRGISNIKLPPNAGSFCLLDKKVLDAINALPEKYRLFRGLRAWAGFKSKVIFYKRVPRKQGKSYYNIPEYIRHAERGFFGFSYIPLDIILYLGFFLFSLSVLFLFLYIPYLIIANINANPLLFIIVMMFLFAGVQLASTSIIGKYVQIAVEESRNRPLYIVEEKVNVKPDKKNKS